MLFPDIIKSMNPHDPNNIASARFAKDAPQISLTWVDSLGGPLIVVPASALAEWAGVAAHQGAGINASTDYDRACEVEGLAGVLAVGQKGAQGLVLADAPSSTCYLPEHRVFLRWIAADSDAQLVAAAEVVLAASATQWEEYGIWETDEPALLMDSALAGDELDIPFPNGELPTRSSVPIGSGRWRVRAVEVYEEHTWVGLVQLIPAAN